MKYKIGEVSKLIGISSQTIRRYEKSSLLKISKDKNNNYRYFSIISFLVTLRIVYFKHLNYGFNEIKRILQSKDKKDVISILRKNNNKMKEEIKLLNEKIKRIDDLIKVFEEFDTYNKKAVLCISPDFYYVEFCEESTLNCECIESFKMLVNKMPFSNSSPIFKKNKKNLLNTHYNYSLIIEARYLTDTEKNKPGLIHLPPKQALYTMVECNTSKVLDIHDLHFLFDEASNLGKLINIIFGRTISTYNCSSQMTRVHEFWAIIE